MKMVGWQRVITVRLTGAESVINMSIYIYTYVGSFKLQFNCTHFLHL